MNLTLRCECSRQIEVHVASAGTRISCECGHELKVPSLGQFRAQAGLSAIPLNNVELIATKLQAGELPGAMCAGCGSLNSTLFPFVAHCEKSYSEQGGNVAAGFSMLLQALLMCMFPLLTLMRGLSRHEDVIESGRRLGRDISTPVPLRLCDACQQIRGAPLPWASVAMALIASVLLVIAWAILPRPILLIIGVVSIVTLTGLMIVTDLERQPQRKWKTWLKLVPDYERLLQEFPTAGIQLPRTKQRVTTDEMTVGVTQ